VTIVLLKIMTRCQDICEILLKIMTRQDICQVHYKIMTRCDDICQLFAKIMTRCHDICRYSPISKYATSDENGLAATSVALHSLLSPFADNLLKKCKHIKEKHQLSRQSEIDKDKCFHTFALSVCISNTHCISGAVVDHGRRSRTSDSFMTYCTPMTN